MYLIAFGLGAHLGSYLTYPINVSSEDLNEDGRRDIVVEFNAVRLDYGKPVHGFVQTSENEYVPAPQYEKAGSDSVNHASNALESKLSVK